MVRRRKVVHFFISKTKKMFKVKFKIKMSEFCKLDSILFRTPTQTSINFKNYIAGVGGTFKICKEIRIHCKLWGLLDNLFNLTI